jgi:hypothetical protein
MDTLLQDLRYAVRMIAKSPGIAAIAFLTIGVATGANATVFGFVSALLLRPAPGVVEPGSLISVFTSDYSSGPYGSSSYPDYLSLKSDAPAFSRMAAELDNSAGNAGVFRPAGRQAGSWAAHHCGRCGAGSARRRRHRLQLVESHACKGSADSRHRAYGQRPHVFNRRRGGRRL